MAFKMESSQLKIAEKLVILNDRAVGMLTRIYNIKKACADAKSKPAFLSDKHMENAIKHIARKFPVVDARMNTTTFHYVDTMKEDIIKSLGLYYYTFADLMDLKDNILQLLTTMDACQCQLDISLNYELTAGYLNLVVNLICLMILLSRVDDRKVVLGLFNAAYDLTHVQSEASFPRLGQMILDYDHPLRKLSEDLGPLNRLISSALSSLSPVYLRRNITASTWRNAQILSLTANPHQILYAAQTDTIACEYLSLDVMDRWIVLCTTVCHSSLLNDKTIFNLWQMSLQMGVCIRLFRDEIFQTHHEIQQFFDSVKGYHKRSQEVKDCFSIALQQSASIHADRRRFLRVALRELCLFIKDQPGLLGPKILFVWMALSFTRDEVLWLLRHLSEWPSSNKKGSKQSDELVDRQLPELLYYMLELRQLVTKHSDVIQRYYLKYVNGYDAIMTRELVSAVGDLHEDDAAILSDFANSISSINSDTDLRALRLDWFRFQAKMSMARSACSLQKNRKLAIVMNTNVFHLKMIDLQDEMLKETSDLSVYCFYIKTLERQWRNCLTLPSQSRFALCFARICGHFSSALHDMCPEEKNHILEKSLAICNSILDDVCQSITDVMGALCEHELLLAEQTSPSTIAAQIVTQMLRSKGGKSAAAAAAAQKEPIQAGEESYRLDRQTLTYSDKLHTTLIELCAGVSQYRQLFISDHFFAPREYLSQHIEHKFVELILAMASDGASSTPRRPSDLLRIIQSYMTVLQNIDACVPLDITRLFNNVLLQQTQPLDSRNKETMTYIYTKWYLEVVLRRASAGHMLWSEHLQAMISSGEGNEFAPEQYTDPRELRCLAQIIGPYGVKYLAERLTWHVASQIGELNKIVVANKDVLHIARTQFDCNERMKEVIQTLSHEPKEKKGAVSSPSDAILQRTAIIGQIFSFRDALHVALEQVLLNRLPFLMSSFTNLFSSMDDAGKSALGELGAAMGVQGPVDVALANAVRAQSLQINPDEHYQMSCLLLVAIAISLPKLALIETATYKPSLRASMNNTHCIPLAVNTIAGALFHHHGRADTHLRMKEFLALASSSVLRAAQELDGRQDAVSNQATLYILLEQFVNKCRWLSMDVLEACFPYNLVRTAYQHCYQQEADTFQ
ncbi:Membrane associated protein Hem [Trichostrongylus colubriformis]|uniref:Membrane associated protein Hem n=1 Tax=Trichostrongylus colubriformis TaxID=6319 RepID=A0AAN8FA51_TRICO